MWPTMEATHFLESRGQVLLAASKYSMEATHQLESQGKVSPARYKCGTATHKLKSQDKCCEQVQFQLTTEVTYFLESQGQASSVGSKSSSPWQPLTSWRAKDGHCQRF